jgi:tetratricopeptide (TPR) repeat protein
MIAGAHFRLSGLWRAKGDPERGLTHAAEAVAHLPATSPSDMRATLLVAQGDVLIQLARPAEAVPVLLAAVGAALDSDDGYLVASTRRALALGYRDAGQLLDASDVAEESIAGFDAAGDHHSANGMRYLLAQIQVALNEPDSALALYAELVASCRAHGTLGGLPSVLTDSADLLDRLDRDALAAERYREAGDAAAADDPYRTAYCRYQEALSLLWSGRREAALTVLAEAEQTVASLPADGAKMWHEAQLASNAVRILRSADRLPEAVANAERALALFTELDDRTRMIGAQLMLGEVLLRSERAGEAEPVLRAALDAVTGQGGRSQHIAATLATALDQLGRSDEATEVRAAAGIQPA